MTQQRQLISNIIRRQPVHLSAAEIFELAREEMPGIARGTVYRNLGLMVAEGEIRSLDIPGQPARFDRSPEPHAHKICERCGMVEDLPPVDLNTLLPPLCPEGFTSCDLRIYHLCPICQKTR